MIAVPTKIPEVLVIKPKVFADNRGWLYEAYNLRELSSLIGQSICFVQENISHSNKGVLRGLHFQKNSQQAKLISVLNGSIFDVVVDVRKESATYGQWVGLELSSKNNMQLWVPEGFAHGFLALSEDVEVIYRMSNYWDPESERAIAWNDPTLNIDWPDIGMGPFLSERDAVALSWEQIFSEFNAQ